MTEDAFRNAADLVLAVQQARRAGWEFRQEVGERYLLLIAINGGLAKTITCADDLLETIEGL